MSFIEKTNLDTLTVQHIGQEHHQSLQQDLFENFLRDHLSLEEYIIKSQSAVYVTTSPDDSYSRFVKVYREELAELFPQYTIEPGHNWVHLSTSDPKIYFPKTYYRGFEWVAHFSDNDTFYLNCGEEHLAHIIFRPFGLQTIKLSRIFVLPSRQRRGIGSKLIELCKTVARELNVRVMLEPSPLLGSAVADNSEEAAERLRRWYAKLGFVNALPEMFSGFRLINNDPIFFGLCGMMVYRAGQGTPTQH